MAGKARRRVLMALRFTISLAVIAGVVYTVLDRVSGRVTTRARSAGSPTSPDSRRIAADSGCS